MSIAAPTQSGTCVRDRSSRPATRVSSEPAVVESSAKPGRNAAGCKTVPHVCTGCKRTYQAVLKEVVRAPKRGRDLYCSKTCRSFHTNRADPADKVALWLTEPWLQEAYADAYRSARKGATGRGLSFDYSKEDFNAAIRECENRCTLTGIAFENSSSETSGDRRMFIPSIDRIDSKKGYSKDNIRIVCSIANLGMNTGGEGPLIRMSLHLTAKVHGLSVEELASAIAAHKATKAP
jgi:hypothetical protein